MIVPRTAREKSKTGIYHIMMRGIDKRHIFLQNQDYKQFFVHLQRAKTKSDAKVLAYCLMKNHVHLLIKEGSEEIGNTIRRINVGYALYHNFNYERVGHLFQDRFKSEPVNDEGYLYTVFRYIHQNPVQAELVNNIEHYPWSSYKEYLKKKPIYIDQDPLQNPLWERFSSESEYRLFHQASVDEQCMDYKENNRITEKELRAHIEKTMQINNLLKLSKKDRNGIIKRVKEETGASIRQMEKVLGVGRCAIHKSLR